MTVFLNGLAVRFFRGIGPTTQYIGPFSKLNFFIGQNNAGKSIILGLLSGSLANLMSSGSARLDPVEIYRGGETGQIFVGVAREIEVVSSILKNAVEQNKSRMGQYHIHNVHESIDDLVQRLSHNGLVWFQKRDAQNWIIHPEVDRQVAKNWPIEWQKIWTALTQSSQGSPVEHWIPQTLERLAQMAQPRVPKILLIPAKRQIGVKGESFTDLSGRGLIDHLASLQNPSFDKQSDRDLFEKINLFLQEITGKSDARLEVPSEREHILVHMDSKVLPLSSLGTGIHEVALIAAFCTINSGCIMCIEEPEVHLHPLLQKKLLNYLVQKTSNQYFIATHSSAFLDSGNPSIFHVSNDGKQTSVKSVLTRNQQREILDDLGCHASDILQSNAIVWVEGPSDRIYLNHWIKSIDPRIEEGIHYTIMFYGGALIRHLSASDVALEGFIRLRDLNRNMAVVLDSDKTSETDSLKPHANRIFTEMNEGAGLVWVTKGREIENYVDGPMLQAALKSLHPKIYHKAAKTSQFDHAFYFYRSPTDGRSKLEVYKDGDKVGAASIVCQSPANLDILDLRERIFDIVNMILRANALND